MVTRSGVCRKTVMIEQYTHATSATYQAMGTGTSHACFLRGRSAHRALIFMPLVHVFVCHSQRSVSNRPRCAAR